jgi:serine phosphatase RsbU (regulator of sigma subunit)
MILLERSRRGRPTPSGWVVSAEDLAPAPADLYVFSLALVAVCALLVGWSQHSVQRPRDLLVFGVLAAAAGSQKLWVPNSLCSRISIGYIFVIVSLPFLGMAEAMLVAAASGLTGSLVNLGGRPTLREGVFNVSAQVISAALAGKLLLLFGRTPGDPQQPVEILPILAAAAVYFLCNSALAAAGIAFAEERPVWQVWRQGLRWTAAVALAGSCLAILMALAYGVPQRTLFYLSLPLAYVLFAAYQATLERMAESRQHVEDQDQSARELFAAYRRVGAALAAPLDIGALHRLIVELGQEMLTPLMSGLCLRREGGLELSDALFASTFPSSRTGEVAEALQQAAATALERGQPTSSPTEGLRPGSPGAIMFAVPLQSSDGVHGALCVLYEPWSELTDARRQFLTSFSAQAALALQNARRFELEQDVADTMRQCLLPPRQIVARDLEIGTHYEPLAIDAGRIGGDYYDLLTLPDGRIAASIADVCGKGMEAAVRTALIKYTVRSYAVEAPWPMQVLNRANSALVAQETDIERFTTLSYALLDPRAGTLCLAAAGHPPALLYRAAIGRCVSLEAGGAALGVLPDAGYEEVVESFEPGDVLLLYTDGVLEARCGGEEFGLERLEATFQSTARRPPAEIATAIVAAAREFAAGKLSDDVTLLVVKHTGSRE